MINELTNKKEIMRKTKFYVLVLAAAMAVAGFAGCTDEVEKGKNDENNYEESVERVVKGNIDESLLGNLEGYKISTFTNEGEIKNGQFKLNTPANDLTQTFIVGNENGDVFLMARTPIGEDEGVYIDAWSTALSMVTMHPLFAPVGGNDYLEVVELITSSDQYEPFYQEVEKVVRAGRPIFNENNEGLLMAFSNLMESICGGVDEEVYTDSLEMIPMTEAMTKAEWSLMPRKVSKDSPYFPFYTEISGNTLVLRNTGLTPTYYGTVTLPDGSQESIAIESRNDYGGMDLFLKTLEDFNLGDPIEYIFLQEGNHRFNLSRTNAAAAADYFLRLANTLLSALGIDLSNDGMILDLGNMLNQRLIYMSAGVSNPSFDKELWANTAYEIVLKWSEKHGLRLLAANTAKMLTSAFNWYDKIKGGISLALRLAYAIDAPAEVRFCLCFHDGYLSTCTNANLEKIDGDGQKGYAMQKLLLPLKVKVTTYDEDGKELAPGEFHRVKFEVTSGGGKIETELVAADTCGFASTNWTLGKEGVQRIKASVIDVITEQEIAMPVYFTASIEKADVTVRLDWTKVDEYTDIDLHVIDPFGERIFFDNPTSVSGGFLDRDDTEGPGPEHIHWDNAPAGTYKIYVHYYDSESAAMTTYKVSVTAAGVTYKPVTGSITYDQMVPIGQFVIGENSSTTTKAEIVKKQNMTVDGLKPIGKTKKITLKNTTAKIDRK